MASQPPAAKPMSWADRAKQSRPATSIGTPSQATAAIAPVPARMPAAPAALTNGTADAESPLTSSNTSPTPSSSVAPSTVASVAGSSTVTHRSSDTSITPTATTQSSASITGDDSDPKENPEASSTQVVDEPGSAEQPAKPSPAKPVNVWALRSEQRASALAAPQSSIAPSTPLPAPIASGSGTASDQPKPSRRAQSLSRSSIETSLSSAAASLNLQDEQTWPDAARASSIDRSRKPRQQQQQFAPPVSPEGERKKQRWVAIPADVTINAPLPTRHTNAGYDRKPRPPSKPSRTGSSEAVQARRNGDPSRINGASAANGATGGASSPSLSSEMLKTSSSSSTRSRNTENNPIAISTTIPPEVLNESLISKLPAKPATELSSPPPRADPQFEGALNNRQRPRAPLQHRGRAGLGYNGNMNNRAYPAMSSPVSPGMMSMMQQQNPYGYDVHNGFYAQQQQYQYQQQPMQFFPPQQLPQQSGAPVYGMQPYDRPSPLQFYNPPLDPTRHWVLGQIEYYFDVQNLVKDTFLRKQMNQEGWVDIALVASFNRVKQLTTDLDLIKDTMLLSPLLEVDQERNRVRKLGDWHVWVLPQQ
ncbi:uncharacterized protein L969DRAFT_42540 [Mixia osmundae IAM 14324]|uniref:HTH La-type RNA-binding domain-containing protein n=1 Tax=Mixia osmundae (strain CBS 9802 / IAM 14324 / JCM 22182 / KY 12970) TaxID=764103 RepID=G7E3S8_MIXOS|nr:uncharacterized protein L969DRAFT_42540 [Mixia osmundae IAM 14324]KEI41933.1 hypothetical protein L969DRAFT_42540 [Mixia osmundae IAM 14324]GAA97488.1 hypothetical protein E5Q_04166 [Mixia osmundae IAM 14324]